MKTILQVKPTKSLEKAAAAEIKGKDEVDERKVDALLSGEFRTSDEDSKKDSP